MSHLFFNTNGHLCLHVCVKKYRSMYKSNRKFKFCSKFKIITVNIVTYSIYKIST